MNDNIVPLEGPNPRFLAESEALASPEGLVSEAHHRIANSLALIAGIVRMHGRSIAKRTMPVPVEDVRRVLEEVGLRLEAVGRLHRYLAPDESAGAVDLAAYLRDVLQSAVESLSFAGQMRLSFDISEACPVPSNTALLVGLCVSELVMNTIKHAHPSGVAGHVLIGCNRSGGWIVVEIVDDGIGFPEGFQPATDGETGLQLVRSLANQLRAHLLLEDTGVGVRARLSVPDRLG
jgi:two-component sensor histidine kinase